MSTKSVLQSRLAAAQSKRGKKSGRNASKSVKADTENKRGKKAEEKKTRKPALIQWTKKEQHPLTDELLTLIDGKSLYRQAFGFDKGQSEPVTTGRKTLVDLHLELASKFFGVSVSDDDADNSPLEGKYTKEDLPELVKVVKNRIANLKSNYHTHRQALGSTGHGLVMDGKEKKIMPGTEIANAWDVITTKFPWYKHMHALMGTSP
ncbi:hypothetical protein B0H14DRAFT_3160877, partial [Mycena olivaceomarginata]